MTSMLKKIVGPQEASRPSCAKIMVQPADADNESASKLPLDLSYE
jgi:hypothetical protein